MEKRLLLVFVLTFVVLLLFQPFLSKYIKQPAAPAKQNQEQAAPAPPAPVNSGSVAVATARAAASVPGKVASGESEMVVENDLYRITLTNRGAQAKSWILKKYKDDQGRPLELINTLAAHKVGLPLSLWTYDTGLKEKLNSVLYVASQSGAMQEPPDVTFEYADGDLAVRKHFHFDHSYIVQVETSVTQKGIGAQAFPAWPGGFGDQTNLPAYASSRIDYAWGDKIERLALKKISGGGTVRGPFAWAAAADQYFGAVFMPDQPNTAVLITLHDAVDIPKKPGAPETQSAPITGVAAGDASGVTRERLFVGPKNLAVLEAIKVPNAGESQDLRGLVDFGTFGLIARPLFLWLRWTHDHWVANWGWSILILTIIINLTLFPLRLTSMKSALKMQKVQPQMNAIKEKYKKYGMRDPRRQEMNTEIGALMKREGVNPAGGCLPMIIQLPFLFAFYRMLGGAIELRQANWLWLKDLSSPDPLYILPVLIVVSTLIVQRMTPQAGMDPAQQKMMTFMMPMMLGFISWSLASGLSIYWVAGNFIGVAQQVLMNRTQLGREMRAEAEKRARKQQKK